MDFGLSEDQLMLEATVRHGGRARFYAELYIGLHHEAFGRNQQAREHLVKAAELSDAGVYLSTRGCLARNGGALGLAARQAPARRAGDACDDGLERGNRP